MLQKRKYLDCGCIFSAHASDVKEIQLYGFAISDARNLMIQLKSGKVVKFTFFADDQDVFHFPSWVKSAKQITDGHLAQLAKTNGAILATLDGKIPGAHFIPTQKLK